MSGTRIPPEGPLGGLNISAIIKVATTTFTLLII